MHDDTSTPEIEPLDDDFEAHGLKEGLAIALGAGALAVSGTAQAYIPASAGSEERPVRTAPAKQFEKKTAKKKSAKKSAAKTVSVSGGMTSPKKPLIDTDA